MRAARITAILFSLVACTEYDIKKDDGPQDGSDGSGAEGGGEDSEAAIEVDSPLDLLSTCDQIASGGFEIRSVGTDPLTVSEITVDWDDQGQVELTPAAALPLDLAPGEALSVDVTWEPEGAEAMGGIIRVSSNDPIEPQASVTLSGAVGDGSAPLVALSVPDCYTVLAGDTVDLVAEITDEDAPEDLVVTWESSLDGVVQTGPADADRTSSLSASLSAGAHTITVTVTNACGQTATATVEINVVEARGTYSGGEPDGLDFDGDGYLWVADYGSDLVYQLDPATLGILRKIDLPYSGADGLSWMDTTMLVSFYASNRVVAIDTCDGSELWSWRAPGSGVSDVSWDGSALWLTDYDSGRIFQVDPTDGHALATYSAPVVSPNGLTWDGTQFWLTANGTTPTLARLDSSFAIVERYSFRGTDPRGIAWDGSEIWYSDGSSGLITTLSP